MEILLWRQVYDFMIMFAFSRPNTTLTNQTGFR